MPDFNPYGTPAGYGAPKIYGAPVLPSSNPTPVMALNSDPWPVAGATPNLYPEFDARSQMPAAGPTAYAPPPSSQSSVPITPTVQPSTPGIGANILTGATNAAAQQQPSAGGENPAGDILLGALAGAGGGPWGMAAGAGVGMLGNLSKAEARKKAGAKEKWLYDQSQKDARYKYVEELKAAQAREMGTGERGKIESITRMIANLGQTRY